MQRSVRSVAAAAIAARWRPSVLTEISAQIRWPCPAVRHPCSGAPCSSKVTAFSSSFHSSSSCAHQSIESLHGKRVEKDSEYSWLGADEMEIETKQKQNEEWALSLDLEKEDLLPPTATADLLGALTAPRILHPPSLFSSSSFSSASSHTDWAGIGRPRAYLALRTSSPHLLSWLSNDDLAALCSECCKQDIGVNALLRDLFFDEAQPSHIITADQDKPVGIFNAQRGSRRRFKALQAVVFGTPAALLSRERLELLGRAIFALEEDLATLQSAPEHSVWYLRPKSRRSGSGSSESVQSARSRGAGEPLSLVPPGLDKQEARALLGVLVHAEDQVATQLVVALMDHIERVSGGTALDSVFPSAMEGALLMRYFLTKGNTSEEQSHLVLRVLRSLAAKQPAAASRHLIGCAQDDGRRWRRQQEREGRYVQDGLLDTQALNRGEFEVTMRSAVFQLACRLGDETLILGSLMDLVARLDAGRDDGLRDGEWTTLDEVMLRHSNTLLRALLSHSTNSSLFTCLEVLRTLPTRIVARIPAALVSSMVETAYGADLFPEGYNMLLCVLIARTAMGADPEKTARLLPVALLIRTITYLGNAGRTSTLRKLVARLKLLSEEMAPREFHPDTGETQPRPGRLEALFPIPTRPMLIKYLAKGGLRREVKELYQRWIFMEDAMASLDGREVTRIDAVRPFSGATSMMSALVDLFTRGTWQRRVGDRGPNPEESEAAIAKQRAEDQEMAEHKPQQWQKELDHRFVMQVLLRWEECRDPYDRSHYELTAAASAHFRAGQPKAALKRLRILTITKKIVPDWMDLSALMGGMIRYNPDLGVALFLRASGWELAKRKPPSVIRNFDPTTEDLDPPAPLTSDDYSMRPTVALYTSVVTQLKAIGRMDLATTVRTFAEERGAVFADARGLVGMTSDGAEMTRSLKALMMTSSKKPSVLLGKIRVMFKLADQARSGGRRRADGGEEHSSVPWTPGPDALGFLIRCALWDKSPAQVRYERAGGRTTVRGRRDGSRLASERHRSSSPRAEFPSAELYAAGELFELSCRYYAEVNPGLVDAMLAGFLRIPKFSKSTVPVRHRTDFLAPWVKRLDRFVSLLRWTGEQTGQPAQTPNVLPRAVFAQIITVYMAFREPRSAAEVVQWMREAHGADDAATIVDPSSQDGAMEDTAGVETQWKRELGFRTLLADQFGGDSDHPFWDKSDEASDLPDPLSAAAEAKDSARLSLAAEAIQSHINMVDRSSGKRDLVRAWFDGVVQVPRECPWWTRPRWRRVRGDPAGES